MPCPEYLQDTLSRKLDLSLFIESQSKLSSSASISTRECSYANTQSGIAFYRECGGACAGVGLTGGCADELKLPLRRRVCPADGAPAVPDRQHAHLRAGDRRARGPGAPAAAGAAPVTVWPRQDGRVGGRRRPSGGVVTVRVSRQYPGGPCRPTTAVRGTLTRCQPGWTLQLRIRVRRSCKEQLRRTQRTPPHHHHQMPRHPLIQ